MDCVGPSSVGCLWCVCKASVEHHEGALLRVGAAFEIDAENYVENLCVVVWMSTMGGNRDRRCPGDLRPALEVGGVGCRLPPPLSDYRITEQISGLQGT